MILREMMPESLQSMPLPAQGSTPVSAQEKSGGVKSLFGDVLSSTVREKERNEMDRRSNDAAEGRRAAKTFREISNKIRHEAKKPVSNDRPEAADEPVKDKNKTAPGKEINQDTAGNLINGLAQILGMDPGEFTKLLQAAGISPEELANMSDAGQLTAKLSAVLGLNQEQSGALKDLLEMVKAQMQAQTQIPSTAQSQGENSASALQTTAVNGTENPEDAVAVRGTDTSPQIEIVKDPGTEFAALMEKMKLKLNEIRDRLKNGREELAGEISGKLEAAMKDRGEDAKIQPADGAKTAETGKDPNPIAAAGGSQDKAQNGEQGNADGSREGKTEKKADGAGLKPAETVTLAANDDNSQLTAPGAGQLQKAEEIFRVEKAGERTPVQTKEIISQVLEKAKVVLTGDKSEMVMDLKPDSLGKLSLKVVTEHGIVMAKFVAENQQVKQVLESNMQLLKDSLEKQGMNVQGFSVSVRQDGRQNPGGQNEAGSSERMSHRKAVFGTERLTTAIDRIAAVERHNPYSVSTSTVNFTA